MDFDVMDGSAFIPWKKAGKIEWDKVDWRRIIKFLAAAFLVFLAVIVTITINMDHPALSG